LRAWLRHGEPALGSLKEEPGMTRANTLSQRNVIQQLEHLRSYPLVDERLRAGKLRLHAWWFELKNADVYAYESEIQKFVLFDEEEAARILARL
jgi:carbonic anhydrase